MPHFQFTEGSSTQLVEQIHASLAKGETLEQVYVSLLQGGAKVEAIEKAVREARVYGTKEDSGKRSVHTIVIFGALLVGAGIFSFVAANWTEMTKVMKIGIIMISMLSSYGLGWYFHEKKQLEKVGNAFYLLGTLIYGAGIFLIAQMFHVRQNWPDGLLLWMLGSLAMGFVLRSGTHFFLALALGLVAAFGHSIELFTGTFGYRVFFTTSTFLLIASTITLFFAGNLLAKEAKSEDDPLHQFFLVLFVFFSGVTLLGLNADFGDPLSWRIIFFAMSALGIGVAYYFKTVFPLIFSVVMLSVWWGAQSFQWIDLPGIEPLSLYVGYILYAALLVVLGRIDKKFGSVYSLFGTLFLIGSLFFFSLQSGLHALVSLSDGLSMAGSWQMVVSYAVLLGGLGMALIRARLPLYENLVVLAHVVFYLFLLILPPFSLFVDYDTLSSGGLFMAILFNVLILAQLIGIIALGYYRRASWMINMGVIGMFLFILVKYFDWFFTFLDKSLFFIGAGLLLFGVGWLMERTRRRMIADIDPTPHE